MATKLDLTLHDFKKLDELTVYFKKRTLKWIRLVKNTFLILYAIIIKIMYVACSNHKYVDGWHLCDIALFQAAILKYLRYLKKFNWNPIIETPTF